jgi:hypothetical protein
MKTFGALGILGLIAAAGVLWFSSNPVVVTARVEPLKPSSAIPAFKRVSVPLAPVQPDAQAPAVEESVQKERDKLRRDLLEASTAYERSPCDDTAKRALVAALANYVSGWLSVFNCTSGAGVCPRSRNARFDLATAAFRTPADVRALEAMRKATAQGGITLEDFPRSIRENVAIWMSSTVAPPQAACIGDGQSANRR